MSHGCDRVVARGPPELHEFWGGHAKRTPARSSVGMTVVSRRLHGTTVGVLSPVRPHGITETIALVSVWSGPCPMGQDTVRDTIQR